MVVKGSKEDYIEYYKNEKMTLDNLVLGLNE